MFKHLIFIAAVLSIASCPVIAALSNASGETEPSSTTRQVWSFESTDGTIAGTKARPYDGSIGSSTLTVDYGNGISQDFDTAYIIEADINQNDWGTPIALIGGMDNKVPFKYHDTAYDGIYEKSGVWSGHPIAFELIIPNTDYTGGSKTIWMEITAAYWERTFPAITAFDSNGNTDFLVTALTPLPQVLEQNGPWQTLRYGWQITPNPQSETITNISFSGTGGFVDHIVVETVCVPEPASLCLLAAGGLAFLRKRNIR